MGKGGTLGWLKPARAIVPGFALLLLVALALSGGLQIHREPGGEKAEPLPVNCLISSVWLPAIRQEQFSTQQLYFVRTKKQEGNRSPGGKETRFFSARGTPLALKAPAGSTTLPVKCQKPGF
jgi:hypothetical protein